jgi:type VI secretion system secreted protein Hcp
MADCFIKLDQVRGESEDPEYRGAIQVTGWRWGAHWAEQSGMSGTRTGRGSVQAFSFTHLIDTASPSLMLRCVQGAQLPTATLAMRRAGGTALTYLKLVFKKVRIVAVELTQDGSGEVPVETVSFSFESVEYDYVPQGAAGGAGGGASSMNWRAAE